MLIKRREKTVMKRVLIDRPLHKKALAELESYAEVVKIYNNDKKALKDSIKTVDAVICSVALKMTEEMISIAKNLRVIGRPGVGYDSVDIKAATKEGIPVVYAPNGPTESVAEHVIAFMLMLAKKIEFVERALRKDGDFGIRTRVTGMELKGKTLGLIGAGRIGKRVGEIAGAGLGMKIHIYDPFFDKDTDLLKGNFTLVADLNELLETSDVISLHIPYTEDTEKFIGKQEFKRMKKEAIFINTARGKIVDEQALIEALKNGEIQSAGLDVYEKEPPDPDNPLFKLDNTVVTPHLSSFTDDGKMKMGMAVVKGVIDVLEGNYPEFIVNSEVWNKRRK